MYYDRYIVSYKCTFYQYLGYIIIMDIDLLDSSTQDPDFFSFPLLWFPCTGTILYSSRRQRAITTTSRTPLAPPCYIYLHTTNAVPWEAAKRTSIYYDYATIPKLAGGDWGRESPRKFAFLFELSSRLQNIKVLIVVWYNILYLQVYAKIYLKKVWYPLFFVYV